MPARKLQFRENQARRRLKKIHGEKGQETNCKLFDEILYCQYPFKIESVEIDG